MRRTAKPKSRRRLNLSIVAVIRPATLAANARSNATLAVSCILYFGYTFCTAIRKRAVGKRRNELIPVSQVSITRVLLHVYDAVAKANDASSPRPGASGNPPRSKTTSMGFSSVTSG